MDNLYAQIQNYRSSDHWDYVRQICSLAERLGPEQTLRVHVGTSTSEEGIKDSKHAANKLKQSLFGRISGFTPSVRVHYAFVFLDINKHKQKKEAT